MEFPKIKDRINELESYYKGDRLSHSLKEELTELKKALKYIELLTEMVACFLAKNQKEK